MNLFVEKSKFLVKFFFPPLVIIAFLFLYGSPLAVAQTNRAASSPFYDSHSPTRDEGPPVKCGTPLMMEYHFHPEHLSTREYNKAKAMIRQSRFKLQALQTYISPSGKFEIQYKTSGKDGVSPADVSPSNGVPDYVDKIAAAADSAYRYEVLALGYTDPILPGQTYKVQVKNFNFYGQTFIDNGTTVIQIENDFAENFPPNTDPDGKQAGDIKVTMAHEFKHAVQYANSKWYSSGDPKSPHGAAWSEMDATYMEEVVYDNVNDYYNYFNGKSTSNIFESADHSIPVAYDGVSWFLYFKEKFGLSFWIDIWKNIKKRYDEENAAGSDNYLSMKDALIETLNSSGYNTTLANVFTESELWHYASGGLRSLPNYGFEEKDFYPDPTINASFIDEDSLKSAGSNNSGNASALSLGDFTAYYAELEPAEKHKGYLTLSVHADNDMSGIGLLAYFNDGHYASKVTTISSVSPDLRRQRIETKWKWNNLRRVGIITANAGNVSNYVINFFADVPKKITLGQNYPNPFNPETVIPFSLTKATKVQIKVYDIMGRLVRTLLDENRPKGYYDDVVFDANGLASGVYFYRLTTNQGSLVKKMTLIK